MRWLLNSERVKELVSRDPNSVAPVQRNTNSDIAELLSAALVRREGDGPQPTDASHLSSLLCTIEIPHDINALKEREPKAGSAWREATREAFLAAIDAGFEVTDFLRAGTPSSPRWFYLLTRQR